MKKFADIAKIAAKRKGGADALERLLFTPLPPKKIKAMADDRWLSAMTMCVFQAGFNWRVIENKWPRFEEAFERFDVDRWALMHDGDVDRLLATPGIVANGQKIASVGDNARYLQTLAHGHGSVGAYFAVWDGVNYWGNLRALQTNGSRMGGRTGQIFLRRMGVDTLVFSSDVLAALAREGVISKMPALAKDYAAVQNAINAWRAESGRSLTHISQILAYSVETVEGLFHQRGKCRK